VPQRVAIQPPQQQQLPAAPRPQPPRYQTPPQEQRDWSWNFNE